MSEIEGETDSLSVERRLDSSTGHDVKDNPYKKSPVLLCQHRTAKRNLEEGLFYDSAINQVQSRCLQAKVPKLFSEKAEKTLLTSPTPSTPSFPLPKSHSGEPRPFNNLSLIETRGKAVGTCFLAAGSDATLAGRSYSSLNALKI
jgi:hypothetical protein